MNRNIKDLTGNVYDRLTVIGYSHSDKGFTYWKCLCSCDDNLPTEARKVHIKLLAKLINLKKYNIMRGEINEL